MSAIADLSVVMPTYKHAVYLPRALDALLGQSVRPREVIVVNDASPDETAEIADRYARNDPTVKAIHNECNRGVNQCVALGVAQATGKYLYFSASDDYVLPGFVEKTVGALERYPQAGLCCSYFSIVNGETGEIRENPSCWCDAPRYFSPAETERLLAHASVAGHTTIVKRSSYDAAGGLLADLEWHSDWFLSFVVAFREGMCHVPEMLALLTESSSSYSGQGHRSERQLKVAGAVLDRLASANYADVAPAFARNGALTLLGTPVLAAAARRPDAWSRATLSLINGFTPEQYESLLDDPEEAVRELARFFLGAFWPEVKQTRLQASDELKRLGQEVATLRPLLAKCEQRADFAERELEHSKRRRRETEAELDRTSRLLVESEAKVRHLQAVSDVRAEMIRRMESSYFWKSRQLLAGCKRSVLKPLARLASCW